MNPLCQMQQYPASQIKVGLVRMILLALIFCPIKDNLSLTSSCDCCELKGCCIHMTPIDVHTLRIHGTTSIS